MGSSFANRESRVPDYRRRKRCSLWICEHLGKGVSTAGKSSWGWKKLEWGGREDARKGSGMIRRRNRRAQVETASAEPQRRGRALSAHRSTCSPCLPRVSSRQFPCNLLPMTWKSIGRRPKTFGPLLHMGDKEEAPGSWLPVSSAAALALIREMKQLEDLYHRLSCSL